MERGFNNNLIISDGPHIYSNDTIRRRMFFVFIALLPQLLASITVFGRRALLVILLSVVCCIVFELIVDMSRKNIPTMDDFTCVITGMMIAYGLPSNVKLWIVIVADAVAIIVVKGVIHGKGRNLINPAATGLLAVYAGLGKFLELWPAPLVGSSDIPADAAIIPSAYEIMNGAEGVMSTKMELFLGFCPGPLGMVSTVCLLLGCLFLIWRRVIGWVIPVSVLGTCAFMALLAGDNIIVTLCSGGTAFMAMFMATDPVTSPVKRRAQAIYGVMIGLIMMVFRLGTDFIFGGLLAIVVMNLLGLAIDKFFAFEMYKGLRRKRRT